MKKLLALFALVSVALACNMLGRKGSNTNSGPSSSSGTSSTDSGTVEKPNPTAAQQAAIANGQTVTWGQQGITWTLPANWKKNDERNESLSYSGGGAHLTVAISVMPQMADLVDTSIKAMYEAAKTQQKIGKYDEARWLELDGLRGVSFRESVQERPDDIRRLQWQAYRTYAGSTQLINMILSTDSGDFAKHEDALYGVLYSTKVAH
jgi:hypothetical protein